jgi:hypothetical protein
MLSGYEVAKKVNEVLTSAGLKAIPAQMVYHYIKKGYIQSVDVNGARRVTVEEAARWAQDYLAKRTAKANA